MKRRWAAFTLLELLIVIGIIALLAAILFPVFFSVRDKGRQAVCTSNLRQLGVAFLQYSSDYDERMPLPGSADEYDLDQAGPYWDMADTCPGCGLMPYVKLRSSFAHPAPSIWFCPSMPSYHETVITPPGATVTFQQLTVRSYTMNWYLRDPANDDQGKPIQAETTCENPDPASASELFACAGGLTAPLTISRLVAPADTILLFEGPPVQGTAGSFGDYLGSSRRSGDFSFQKGYFTGGNTTVDVYAAQGINTGAWMGTTPWHASANDCLFCDGHVSAIPVKPYPWVPTNGDNHWYVTRYR